MRHYHFRTPGGLILPGLLGVLILAVVVSVGMVLFAVVLAAMVVIGLGTALYRALFSSGNKKTVRRQHIRYRTTRTGGIDDIPFSEYKEIESGSGQNGNKEN